MLDPIDHFCVLLRQVHRRIDFKIHDGIAE